MSELSDSANSQARQVGLFYDESMSESEIDGPSASKKSTKLSVSARLAQVEEERDRLRAELDAQSNASIASWLEVVGVESRILGDMQNSVSWKVTKPLRLVRKVQIKVAEVGVARTSQLAVADLKRRYLGRRR